MRRVVSAFLIVMMLISLLPLSSLSEVITNFKFTKNNVHAPSNDNLGILYDISISNNQGLSIEELRGKFPDGKFWNSPRGGTNDPDSWTNTPCNHGSSSSSHVCNSFLYSSQCYGFARKLGYDYYGTDPATQWTKYTDRSALENIKPGDIIRYLTHSVFVLDITSTHYIVADCNSDHQCVIRWDRQIDKSRVYNNFRYIWSAPYAISDCEHEYIATNGSVYCLHCGAEYESEYTSQFAKYTSSATTLTVMSKPYTFAAMQTEYTVTGKVNVVGSLINYYGETWYELENGGYVPSQYLTFHGYICDIRVDGATFPSGALPIGQGFPLQGTVHSRNVIDTVVVGIFERDGAYTEQVETIASLGEYSFNISSVDSSILFGQLEEGAYTYVVYAEDSGGSRCALIADFNIGSEDDITYMVRYDANGGYAAPEQVSFPANGSVRLSSEIPQRANCRFKYWNTQADGNGVIYMPGSQYERNESLYLYAIWECDVTFINGMTGNTILQTVVNYGAPAIPPLMPIYNGYVFAGWDADISEITGHTIITAQYELVTILGDADGNGVISSIDALITLRIAMGYLFPSPIQDVICDINQNGIIDALDALAILRVALGNSSEDSAIPSRNSILFEKQYEFAESIGNLG